MTTQSLFRSLSILTIGATALATITTTNYSDNKALATVNQFQGLYIFTVKEIEKKHL